jgi:hypothetical protein
MFISCDEEHDVVQLAAGEIIISVSCNSNGYVDYLCAPMPEDHRPRRLILKRLDNDKTVTFIESRRKNTGYAPGEKDSTTAIYNAVRFESE